ncbi:DUF222 domain-containing protein [Mycobacterium intermedium]|nr:13E12 repeat family protein [Mycobacterium intermedium]MCV6965467.1 DUF222 domain-containing protein [Mycobacterium intermedium]
MFEGQTDADVVDAIAAALRITPARASGHLRYAIALRERLPRLAEVFARGDVCLRVVATVISRVYLVQDPKILAELDQAIAKRVSRWTRLSTASLPNASTCGLSTLIRPASGYRPNVMTFASSRSNRHDPRTKEQRRADAIRALVDGADGLSCKCGSADCAAAQRKTDTNVVIHVLAERATIDGDSEAPGYLPGF